MDRLDVLWQAGLILHREVDPPQVISASVIASCVANNDGPVQITDALMEDNAIKFVAEQIGEDPASLEVFSLTWVGMPFVDASELPPPPQ